MIDSPAAAGFAADVVLVVHALFVAFVVFGQAYVLAGWTMGWNSARNAWFRRLHLAAIAVVVFQAWIGLACPLTTLESGLRQDAGVAAYGRKLCRALAVPGYLLRFANLDVRRRLHALRRIGSDQLLALSAEASR